MHRLRASVFAFDPEGRRRMQSASRASVVGLELAGTVIGGLLLGWWADGKLGTEPVLTVIGLVVGAFSGFWAVVKTLKQIERDQANEERQERDEMNDDGTPRG